MFMANGLAGVSACSTIGIDEISVPLNVMIQVVDNTLVVVVCSEVKGAWLTSPQNYMEEANKEIDLFS